MNESIERIMRILSLKGLVPPSANAYKLGTQGLSGEVYGINSGKEKFILKFYRKGDSSKVIKEMKIYPYLLSFGVPVPKVYFADAEGKIAKRPFLLIQRLEGETFNSLLKKGKGREFVESLAWSLHKFHSAHLSGLDLKLERKTLKEEISELRIMAMVFLAFSVSLSTLRRAYKALSEISKTPLKSGTPALLHGDCSPDNAIYCDGTVYLIDLENVYVGNPAFDVGYAYHFIRFGTPRNSSLADHFVRTYEALHGKIMNLEVCKRLAALKIAVVIKLLSSINLLTVLLLGLRRAMGFLAFRRYLSRFAEYCLEYAEKGGAELSLN